jgi:proteasome lid subunit RPN8/RPN11
MIRIAQADYAAIRAHGEETYPHECCGVLLGKNEVGVGNRVHLIVPAGNTRTDSAHNRYNIAPQELVRIQRQGRGLGFDIVGFYHSHPDHPAQWSPTDFAEAHWIGCSYIITSIDHGKAAITNSFLLTGTSEENKAFEDESVEVEDIALETATTERGEA